LSEVEAEFLGQVGIGHAGPCQDTCAPLGRRGCRSGCVRR
jgi:hypothetical protein